MAGKKKGQGKKVKKKCCEKYLKSGKHCKSCPLFAAGVAAVEKAEAKKKKKKKKKAGEAKAGKKKEAAKQAKKKKK
ncbi:MAG: hypothetical protein Kow0089_20720 [Desulfobulbaceae bacterium]